MLPPPPGGTRGGGTLEGTECAESFRQHYASPDASALSWGRHPDEASDARAACH